MLGNHRTAISHTCDTEALEDALEGACGGNLQVTYRLELRRLATSLWYDAEMNKQGTAIKITLNHLRALTNFKANLQRRKEDFRFIDKLEADGNPEPARSDTPCRHSLHIP